MTVDEINKELDKLQHNLVVAVADSMEIMSASYVADLLRRVQFKGENSKGEKLGTYAKSTSIYKKSKGQQSQYVNLTDTFEMLGSIELQSVKFSGDSVIANIAPNESSRGSVTNKELLAINEKRFGDVMTPTDEELDNMATVLEEALTKSLDRF